MCEKQPLLSISLLSCGKSKYIKNCLESLELLRRQIPCEVIAVDTGCEEDARTLLEQYADTVIVFSWCDDFSKARNVGLDAAKGEWFLYIDDDEWFIDTEEIVHFFISGEYRQYTHACYRVRNYDDFEESRYTDAWVLRMIKREENTHFKNAIHEELTPVLGNCKLLHSTVKHFGYVFESKEAAALHNRRNIALLQRMVRKERDNIRWWTHLLLEYAGLEEYIKLQEFCEEGLEQFKENREGIVNRDRGALYSGLIMAKLSSKQFKEAAGAFEAAIADPRNTDMCRAHLYYMGAMTYFELQDYEKSKDCAAAYIKLESILGSDEEMQFLQATSLVEDAFTEREKNKVLSYLIGSGIKQKDFSVLEKYGELMSWEGAGLNFYPEFISDVIGCLSEVLSETEDMELQENSVEFIRKVLNQKGLETLIWDGLMKLLLKNPNLISHPVVNSLDLPCRLTGISFDKWTDYVDKFYKEASEEDFVKIIELIEGFSCEEDALSARYTYLSLMGKEKILLAHLQEFTYEELTAFLQEFTEFCISFYGRYFGERAFSGEMEMLPPICRSAVKIKELLMWEKDTLLREKIKAAVGIYTPFDDVLRQYARLLVEANHPHTEEAASAEMQMLAKKIIEKARILMVQGMRADALQILQQLKAFIPDSSDIAELEKELLS